MIKMNQSGFNQLIYDLCAFNINDIPQKVYYKVTYITYKFLHHTIRRISTCVYTIRTLVRIATALFCYHVDDNRQIKFDLRDEILSTFVVQDCLIQPLLTPSKLIVYQILQKCNANTLMFGQCKYGKRYTNTNTMIRIKLVISKSTLHVFQ